jgi:hypothetical protein
VKLSKRLEARIALRAAPAEFAREPVYVDSPECRALLAEAAEMARRVEGAAVVRVPKGVPGKLLYLPVSHGFGGRKLRLVPEDGKEVGNG